MVPEQIRQLAEKYLQGTATEEEARRLHEWYDNAQTGDTEVIITRRPETAEDFGAATFAGIKALIVAEKEKENGGTVLRLWPRRLAVAALVLLMAGAAVVYYNGRSRPGGGTPVARLPIPPTDLAPGGNKALLTLADGRTLVLDSAADGTLARQGGTQVIKLNDGRLAYRNEAPGAGAPGYNTLRTPKGGQYQVTLPDGSTVWLNAATTLKFPAAFTGSERRVELEGEAYFEITPDKTKPFTVHTPEGSVQVLGTHFNVNAYSDEAACRTTLLEGRVAVSASGNRVQLRPGQEAAIAPGSGSIKVGAADVEEAVAWKNGYFSFDNADLPAVMRQVARWYDVEVVYEGSPPAERFTGEVPRGSKASEVLKILELSNIRFRIEGKKIIVKP
ncbi:MAG TPA: FecR domain-containing protein [Chitinophagaceae bacterium]|jgi:ferric-dicitrate binding protein FerR (iron transport regulator)|nr:FecR domain-containing protein [Chitinophagaceae bacterium]